jgi:hypothetical protein
MGPEPVAFVITTPAREGSENRADGA